MGSKPATKSTEEEIRSLQSAGLQRRTVLARHIALLEYEKAKAWYAPGKETSDMQMLAEIYKKAENPMLDKRFQEGDQAQLEHLHRMIEVQLRFEVDESEFDAELARYEAQIKVEGITRRIRKL